MKMQKYTRTIGRCLLSLTFICFSVLISKSQEQPPDKLKKTVQIGANDSPQVEVQEQETKKNEIPRGLFAYNKWVDLNENQLVESNEFFGLGKESFSKGEPISVSLYDPNLNDGSSLKIRVWDTSGNLIRTIRKNYFSKPIFTYSGFDSYLPVGEYILTINPVDLGTTYQINLVLKEPNGTAFAKIRKKLLPEGFHLFKQWIDEDGDMKLDSTEVFGLNQHVFNIGELDLELGFNLASSTDEVVYQIWNSENDLLSMNISHLDSLQHYTMKRDSVNSSNEFLRVLKLSPVGEYQITASVIGESLKLYKINLQIVDSLQVETPSEFVEETPVIADIEQEGALDMLEVELAQDTLPEEPKMKMGVTIDVDNLAPEFKKGQEGFFLFSGFIDLNENSVQDKDEFFGATQDYFYSESENVFVQFHLRQFFNKELSLQIVTEADEMVLEQNGIYAESPFVFQISKPDEPLIPGDYTLVVRPEGSEIKYRLELAIK